MLPDNWGWLGNVASQRNVANSADRFGGFSIGHSKIAIFAMQLNVMLLTQDYCFFPKRSILTFLFPISSHNIFIRLVTPCNLKLISKQHVAKQNWY